MAGEAWRSVRVWDPAIRVFHWSLVLVFVASLLSERFGAGRVHVACDAALTLLLSFRLIWGTVGSETARFTAFVRGPRAALDFARAWFVREGRDTAVGHNPLGGWMVVALLAGLSLLVATGLFAPARGGIPAGPLAVFLPAEAAEVVGLLHRATTALATLLAAVHAVAIVAFLVYKGDDLITPMITGNKPLPAGTPEPRFEGAGRAVPALLAATVVAGVICLAVWRSGA